MSQDVEVISHSGKEMKVGESVTCTLWQHPRVSAGRWVMDLSSDRFIKDHFALSNAWEQQHRDMREKEMLVLVKTDLNQ